MRMMMKMEMDPQTTVLYFKVETNDATHYFAARDWGAVKNLVNSPAVKWNEQNLFASGKETVKENAPFFANFEKANYELASDGLYSLGVVSKKTFQTKFRW